MIFNQTLPYQPALSGLERRARMAAFAAGTRTGLVSRRLALVGGLAVALGAGCWPQPAVAASVALPAVAPVVVAPAVRPAQAVPASQGPAGPKPTNQKPTGPAPAAQKPTSQGSGPQKPGNQKPASPAPVAQTPASPAPVGPATASPEPASQTLTGHITDENGNALVGATVLLRGSSRGTSTDAKGDYSLEVPAGENKLMFGYGGYYDEDVVSRGTRPVNVSLTPNPEAGKKKRR